MADSPAGWYPDPERPGAGAARYWDGERWSDQFREPRGSGTDIAITVLGGLLLLSGAIVRAMNARDEEGLEDAETAGSVFGGVLGPLVIVLAVRFVYVRLFAKQARVWSPWVVVAAGVLTWLAAAGGAAGQS